MKKKVSRNSIGRDIEGLDLESVPGGARDVLAKAAHRRQAVLVDVAEEMAAGIAVEAGAPAQDAPVVGGLEEGLDPVLLGKAEQGVVDPREGERALVAGLERRVRGVQVGGAEVEIRAAAGAPVHSHDWFLWAASLLCLGGDAGVGSGKATAETR